MLDAIKQLLDNNVINEDTSVEINEAWESKLSEAKVELKAELREEFAMKYEHDKTTMVEALDKMVTEGLNHEIKEFAEEKQNLAEDRVKFKKQMNENSTKFNHFMTAKLAEEIKELRKDRQIQNEGMEKLESFIAKQLAKEINEFAEDKRDIVETKVKLVAEANSQLTKLKDRFVAESSKKVQAHINVKLKEELTSLNEDIKAARQNSFGRQIFEAFSSEFTNTHLNENAIIRNLKGKLQKQAKTIKESRVTEAKLTVLAESKNKEIQRIKDTNTRSETLTDLLSPLNEDKAKIMNSLLESVQTSRLQNTFEKYLPSVMANDTKAKPKAKLTESVRRTSEGNKTAKPQNTDTTNIVDIKKLAGLK